MKKHDVKESKNSELNESEKIIEASFKKQKKNKLSTPNTSLTIISETPVKKQRFADIGMPELDKPVTRALQVRAARQQSQLALGSSNLEKPEWHAPWKLIRVIQGHLGWVQSIAVDPTNQFFATGSLDRTIRIWDLATGERKLTLTGHVNGIRGLALSDRHPYLFSASEDKEIKCWDLEYNRIIRNYHGHLSGVYSLSLHPTLDVLVSGGRDSCARIWDIRTAKEVQILGGHTNTVSSVLTEDANPQVITGSMDSTMKLWDLAAGRCITTLTHHKKGIRALVKHPREFTFCSGSADAIKKFHCQKGTFLKNFQRDEQANNSIINTLSINNRGIMFSGGEDGKMNFWDYKTGYNFQKFDAIVQPGSLQAENSILASSFDITGTRLLTCETDKTIKVYKEDDEATPTTHPLTWKPKVNVTSI